MLALIACAARALPQIYFENGKLTGRVGACGVVDLRFPLSTPREGKSDWDVLLSHPRYAPTTPAEAAKLMRRNKEANTVEDLGNDNKVGAQPQPAKP